MRTFKARYLAALPIVALWPAVAFAQSAPAGSDGAHLNGEAPVVAANGAVGACGNALIPGEPGGTGAPAVNVTHPLGAAPVDNGVNPDQPTQVNMSQVSGTVLHAEGTLLLLQQAMLSDAGTAGPGRTADQNRAVVQLPAGCSAASFTVGEQVTAVGIPMEAGILAAETVQAG
jgi:hypothetical protein